MEEKYLFFCQKKAVKYLHFTHLNFSKNGQFKVHLKVHFTLKFSKNGRFKVHQKVHFFAKITSPTSP